MTKRYKRQKYIDGVWKDQQGGSDHSSFSNLEVGKSGHTVSGKPLADFATVFTVNIKSFFSPEEWAKVISFKSSTVNQSLIIQEAIDFIGNKGGGVLFFPPGLYSAHSQINSDKDNVHLVGSGSAFYKLIYYAYDYDNDCLNYDDLQDNSIISAEAPITGAVIKLGVTLAFNGADNPFDGEPLSSPVTNLRFSNFLVDAKDNADYGIKVVDTPSIQMNNFCVVNSVKEGVRLYSYSGAYRLASWENDVTYSAFSISNDTIAHRLSHNGENYYCISPHKSTTDSEPGVGSNWETYWKVEPILPYDPGFASKAHVGASFGDLHDFYILNVSRDNSSHGLCIYMAVWFQTIRIVGILCREGDRLQCVAGDNYKLSQVFTNNHFSVWHETDKFVEYGYLVAYTTDGLDDERTSYNVFPEDTSKTIKIYKVTKSHVLTSDPSTDTNLTYLGTDREINRGLVVTSMALDIKIENAHCGTGTANRSMVAINRQDSDSTLFDYFLKDGYALPGKSTDVCIGLDFIEIDPQSPKRLVFDKNTNYRFDYGTLNIHQDKHSNSSFSTHPLLSRALNYSWAETFSTESYAPRNTHAAITLAEDRATNNPLIQFQSVADWDVSSYSGWIKDVSSVVNLKFNGNGLEFSNEIGFESSGDLVCNTCTSESSGYVFTSACMNRVINKGTTSTGAFFGSINVASQDTTAVTSCYYTGAWNITSFSVPSTIGYAFGGFYSNFIKADTTANTLYGIQVQPAQITGSTLTANYLIGCSIVNTSGVTTDIDFQYGLLIDSISGATTNYAIYSAGGQSYHAGDFTFNNNITVNNNLTLAGDLSMGGTLTFGGGAYFMDVNGDIEARDVTARTFYGDGSQLTGIEKGLGDKVTGATNTTGYPNGTIFEGTGSNITLSTSTGDPEYITIVAASKTYLLGNIYQMDGTSGTSYIISPGQTVTLVRQGTNWWVTKLTGHKMSDHTDYQLPILTASNSSTNWHNGNATAWTTETLGSYSAWDASFIEDTEYFSFRTNGTIRINKTARMKLSCVATIENSTSGTSAHIAGMEFSPSASPADIVNKSAWVKFPAYSSATEMRHLEAKVIGTFTAGTAITIDVYSSVGAMWDNYQKIMLECELV